MFAVFVFPKLLENIARNVTILKEKTMRVYAISYRIYYANGGAFKYAENPKYENRLVFYSFDERQKWIQDYTSYKNDTMVFDKVKTFAGDIKEVEDMAKVIEAI